MNGIRTFFLGDPFKSGAQTLTPEDVFEILTSQGPENHEFSPYAKTIGFVLNPPSSETENRRSKTGKSKRYSK